MLQLLIKYFIFLTSALLCFQINLAQNNSKTDRIIDAGWKFQSQSELKLRPASVPGCVHLDLLNNQVINDPFYETNEEKQAWIEMENWEYLNTFSISPKEFKNEHIELQFDGLDTEADVYLNDSLIIDANNMFRTWKLDVKSLLKLGENNLLVRFFSPVKACSKKLKGYPHQLPAGCENVKVKVSPFIRKAAYHFGWDWGPRFVTSGIWRPVHLILWNNCQINSVHCQTIKQDEEKAKVKVSVELASTSSSGTIDLMINQQSRKVKLKKGSIIILDTLHYSAKDFWWPNGSGEQTLQNINVEIRNDNLTVDAQQIKFGVRTIDLIQKKDSIGTSFSFNINGIPTFMKGANYIPQDLFLPRVSPNDYEKLIMKAKKAHFNMIRVWGGGIYESDYFYDLCDKHGILIWQDFMFAGSMYPIDKAFTETVLEEVSDNVIRLRNHPSIAIWCGNNEIEVAWNNWGWQKQYGWDEEATDKLWNKYNMLFKSAIPQLLAIHAPEVPYVSTSPLSNWGQSANFNHSSMHYWGVWHGKEPFDNFKKNVPRFMVEYGFQSFPDSTTLSTVINPNNMYLKSDAMSKRQKSYIGNSLITKHSEELFGKANTFSEYIINSQRTQANAYAIAIKAHRLRKGHCMGTLFWQFNDCWQGPSWSVIDYNKKEKLAYEKVKELYQPVVAFIEIINDSIRVSVVSDLLIDTDVQLKLIGVGNKSNIDLWEQQTRIPANQMQVVLHEKIEKIRQSHINLNQMRIEMKTAEGFGSSDQIELNQ